jgi:uncharacterized protein DUF4012
MRRRWWLAAGVLALAGMAFFGYRAVGQASKVKAELTASREPLARASGFSAGSLPERLALVDQAALHAETARLELGRGPLHTLSVVPFLGRDVRVARAVAESADQTVRAVRQVAAAVEPLQHRPPTARTMRQASTALLRLHRTLDQGVRRVGDAKPLFASRSARAEFLAASGPASTTARRAGEGLELAAKLWGPRGSTRYFLAFQNPAEQRGTGGLIGEYGILEASPTGPQLAHVASYGELDDRLEARGGIDLPMALQQRYDEYPIGSSFWAVNVPADLPTVGRMIVSLYQRATGIRVDGVVTADPLAMAAILRVSGPITVGGTRLDGENVVDQTLVRAYVRYERDAEARRRHLQEIASATAQSLRQALRTQPIELLGSLAVAARSRHVQVFSTDPRAQRLFMDLGIAGSAAAPPQGDYLMPVSINSGGNKLDQFLHRTIRYQVKLQPDGGARATASVTLRNDGPASGLPQYVIGPYSVEHRAGQNDQVQTLYVAGAYGFTGAKVDGRPAAASSHAEFGGLALSQVVGVPAKRSVTLAYDLVRTGALQPLSGDRLRYQLLLRPQATVRPDRVVVSVNAPSGWRFAGSPGGLRPGRSTATWSGPLDQERVLSVDLVRPG